MISLIQTARNRQRELARFIESLNNQKDIDFKDIQLIFIDQENNKGTFSALNKNIRLCYIPYHHCSLSHARNIGLQYAEGRYIAFPDDDCWYTPDTLKSVFTHFRNGKKGIIAKGCDETGKKTNKFPEKSQYLSLYKHCGAISYCIFLKFEPSLKFDENLGVGAKSGYLSGEESDYLYHFLSINDNVFYDANIIVHHPNGKTDYFKDEMNKAFGYAKGYGYILRKNRYPVRLVLTAFVRPLAGIFVFAAMLNFHRANYSFNLLKGRLIGYFHK